MKIKKCHVVADLHSLEDILNNVFDDYGDFDIQLNAAIDRYLVEDNECNPRNDDDWHVSTLIHYSCPRCEVINKLLPQEERKGVSFPGGTLRKFNIGKILHTHWQNYNLKNLNVLWGTWRCIHCGKSNVGFSPEQCCGLTREYKEAHLSIPMDTMRITGSVDAILKEQDEYTINDLKTCDPFVFSKLKEADASYVNQVILYMYMFNNGELKDRPCQEINKARIIYINKSTDYTKSYLVNYDEKKAVELIKPFYEFTQNVKNKELPPRTCSNFTCKEAAYCRYKRICFENENWNRPS